MLWVFVAARGLSLVVVSGGYSLLQCVGFSLWWHFSWSTGSVCAGFSSCSMKAQQLWHMGLGALYHVESSWTRDWTRVSCIGRQILIHCSTRGVPFLPSSIMFFRCLETLFCFPSVSGLSLISLKVHPLLLLNIMVPCPHTCPRPPSFPILCSLPWYSLILANFNSHLHGYTLLFMSWATQSLSAPMACLAYLPGYPKGESNSTCAKANLWSPFCTQLDLFQSFLSPVK